MKGLFKILLLSLLVFIVSCSKSKEELPVNAKYTAHIEFSVAEQVNTSHYVVEVSTDGKEFKETTLIFASTISNETYNINLDLTRYYTPNINVVYLRIKSVDNTNLYDYSDVISVKKS